MEKVIEFYSVSKRYGDKIALRNIDISVDRGQVITLLGQNGAGKSTLVSLLAGLTSPTSGFVKVFGDNVNNTDTKQKIGIMLQEVTMMEKIRIGEVIKLFQSYYNNPLDFKDILDLSGLKEDVKRYASSLSGGQTRRLQFALAIVGNPQLLVLDEPTTGMDIDARARFWKNIREFSADGKTLILTTHDLNEAEELTERLIVLHKGNVVTDGKFDDLKREFNLQRIQFSANRTLEYADIKEFCQEQPYEINENVYTLWTTNSDLSLEILFERGLFKKYGIRNITVSEGGLQQIFSSVIKETAF